MDKKEKFKYSDYICPFCLKEKDENSIGPVEMNFANGSFRINYAIHRRCLPKSWGNIFSPIALFEIAPSEFYPKPLIK